MENTSKEKSQNSNCKLQAVLKIRRDLGEGAERATLAWIGLTTSIPQYDLKWSYHTDMVTYQS